jgi:hypothetical protein
MEVHASLFSNVNYVGFITELVVGLSAFLAISQEYH